MAPPAIPSPCDGEEPWLLRPIAFAAHLAQLERLFGPEEMRAVHQATSGEASGGVPVLSP